jgi:long-chain-fatty-acid--CoA ligase ACSBG
LDLGKTDEKLNETLESRLSNIRPGHICSLIYTSGTTGHPKATMSIKNLPFDFVVSTYSDIVTHDSITFMTNEMAEVLPSLYSNYEHIISYLYVKYIAEYRKAQISF